MQGGKLRQRVSILTIVTTKDAYGQDGEAVREEATAAFATLWGDVQDLTGRELFAASEMHAEVTTRITCRFYPGITPSMLARVYMDRKTRTFDILSVTDADGRRRTLLLDCKERVG